MREVDISTSRSERNDSTRIGFSDRFDKKDKDKDDGSNAKKSTRGSSGNGSSNGSYYSDYSERVLSNLYLVSYIFYAFARSIDGQYSFSEKLSTRVMLMLKRILDILLSGLGLVLLSPLFLLLATLVKLDSEGAVFYRQERIGQNRRRSDRRAFNLDSASDRRRNRNRRREDYCGKAFIVYKFRTMIKDAEKKCGPIWATKDDPRITRFGRILRRTRLDELPQLWNVLKGDMSLVGPRPERLYFVCKFAPQIKNYTKRLTFKPGITGLAQVERGYDSSDGDVNKKLRYDLHYINNWNFWKDIQILSKTMLVMLTGKGAF